MITETLTGAFATPELVGREKELEKVLGRIQDTANTRPCIIFLEGPGGIGKTRFLKEIIACCKTMPDVKVSEPLVDAYHLRVHTPIEFVQDVYQSLMPLDSSFREYEKHARVLRNVRLSGEAVQVETQIQQVLDSFVDGLKSFVKNTGQRVVILLDTLERFSYKSGYSIGTGYLSTPDMADTWLWLTGQLKNLSNVVFVAAGRSDARPLMDVLDKSIEVLPISLDTFSLEEAQAYFQAAAAMARRYSAERVAKSLESLTPEEIKLAHELSGGRPIMLALTADYVASGGLLQTLFESSRVAAEKMPQERFKEKILGRFLSLPRLGEVLRYMALTAKGMDADLLCNILGLPLDMAENYLREIEQFSFVKYREDREQKTRTYFLHDELYDLFRTTAFGAALPGAEPDKKEIYKKVIECYEMRFKNVRHDLRKVYEQIQTNEGRDIDWDKLGELLACRSEILLALLYYRLRQDPPKGYRRWVRYDHEAIISGELELALQLQLELNAYLRELNSGSEERDERWNDNLARWSLRLMPVKRAWARGESSKVLEDAQKIETAQSADLHDPLRKAMLAVWKAYALAYINPKAVAMEIEPALQALEPIRESNREIDSWLAKMLTAFACRIRGYAYRVQERIDAAIADYRQASFWLRDVDLKAEIATVNNDLGYALMLKGESSDAYSLVENALELRSEMGLGTQVAYSLNTLAVINIHEGRYKDAIDYASKALAIFQAVQARRGIGLAKTALSEALRRQANVWDSAEAKEQLGRAFENAQEAFAIFEKMGEKSRQVEVLIEMGCARRDMVRLVQDSSLSQYEIQKLVNESREALNEAAKLASDLSIYYRRIDALVNLAWLGFYAGKLGESIENEVEEQMEGLLEDYELPENKSKPKIYENDEYQPLISTQLGKLYMLKGHRFYRDNRGEISIHIKSSDDAARVKNACQELAKYYFLALEHNAFYSLEHRDFRIAKQQIYNRLKTLRQQNLQIFTDCLTELEKNHDLTGRSQLRQMMVKRALLLE